MKATNIKNEILSVNFSPYDKEEILKMVEKRIKNGKQTVIFTPNPQMLLAARKSEELRSLLCSSDINLPDGIGVAMGGAMLGTSVKKRICGIDFGKSLLSLAAKQGYSVFLLGGGKGVADLASAVLKKELRGLNVCGTHHGYFQKSGEENEAVLRKIQKAKPKIVFVCMGFPIQEQWIQGNLSRLPSVRLAIGLGGSLDIWSGKLSRAPLIMRKCGTEWLWRLIKQPSRAKILIQIPQFLFAVWEQKLKRGG